jgi:hypothetical protein
MAELQVGVDIGRTKMLLLAKIADGDQSHNLDTGANF